MLDTVKHVECSWLGNLCFPNALLTVWMSIVDALANSGCVIKMLNGHVSAIKIHSELSEMVCFN